jgi:hypothetical protein
VTTYIVATGKLLIADKNNPLLYNKKKAKHAWTVQKPNSWTISWRLLGIILRVLRLEVSVWILEPYGKGV